MRKSLLGLMAGAVAALQGCGGFDETDTGLQYKIYTGNEGKPIKMGDYVVMNMIYKTEKDSVLFDTYKMKQPLRIMVSQPLFKGEIMEGLTLLTEKDSATFLVNADSLFKYSSNPMFDHPGGKIVFDIKIEQVVSREQMEKELEAERAGQIKDEKEKIEKYVADMKLSPVATGTGLQYVIKRQGTGVIAEEGDTVKVRYEGKLFSGVVFDPGREPIEFVVNKGEVIKGWDEAFLLLAKGTKATLIVPSHLGYGERGAGEVIPPYSPLVFEVELLVVKKKR